MVNTPYLQKKTLDFVGRHCRQLEITEMLEYSMEEIEKLSAWPRGR